MTHPLLRLLQNPRAFYKVSILPKIYSKSPVLGRWKKTTKLQEQFISRLGRYKTAWKEDRNGIVLAQAVSDYEMCIKIAAVSKRLSEKLNCNTGIYSAEYFSKPKSAVANYFSSVRFKSNLDKIYLSFGGKLLYRNNDLYKNQKKIKSLISEIITGLKNKEDVIKIQIEGIKIGDLLYDTYLRYANRPEADLNDPFLKTLIEQAVNIFYVSKDKIDEFKIKALVTSYTTYIYHGIIVRLCLEKNIPVYSIGGYYSLVHQVLKEYPSHANNHFHFKKLFHQLPEKQRILDTYKPQFEKRFKGVIDSATSYMKQSAFSAEKNHELDKLDWSNSVVILAHCFFDSPHIYRDLLFPDFFDWINFTINELLKQNITVIVKQHPNGTFQNDGIFEQLKKTYPTVLFIDKKTSQLQIINSRPKAIVTAYGTAAAEFSYLNFPVVTIYDNPFTAYDFTYLAQTKEEYKELLAAIMQLKPKQDQNRIIEYYYMQYFFFLNGYPVDYLDCAKYKSDTSSENFLADYIPQMTEQYFERLDAITASGFDKIEEEIKLMNT